MYCGKRYRMVIESKKKPHEKDAEFMINELISKELKSSAQSNNSKLTVLNASERYISSKENSLSPSTIRGYKLYLKALPELFKETLIDDVTEEQLQQLAKHLQSNHSVKYTKNIIGFLKSVLKMFRKNFSVNVTYATEIKEEPYIPTAAEVKSILEVAKGGRFEIPIMLAACCGLRRGEILALTPDDLEENNVLHIKKDVVQTDSGKFVLKNCPKTKGSVRDVFVPEEIAKLIRERKVVCDCHPNSINDWLIRTEKKLGIQEFSFHKLRHYFCTTLHENGVPDATIMKLGGWSDPSVMTRIYRHGRTDYDVMKNAAMKTADGIF